MQLYYLWATGGEVNAVVYGSMFFSALSVITSIAATCAHKAIVQRTGHVCICFDVIGPAIARAHGRRTSQIKLEIAATLEISPSLMEVVQPTVLRNGLRLRMNVYVNHTAAIDMGIESAMQLAQRKGELAKIVRDAWRLSSVPLISELNVEKVDSKERRKGMVEIKADSPSSVVELPERVASVEVTAGATTMVKAEVVVDENSRESSESTAVDTDTLGGTTR